MFNEYPKKVKIVEVGPRDGLQNETLFIKTEDKKTFIEKLLEAGLKDIEVTSFVNPKSIPQMADSENLFSLIQPFLGQKELLGESRHFFSLIPNLKGLENALKVGVKDFAIFSATSDTFNKKNINASIEESFERLEDVVGAVKKSGLKLRGYISTVFGCPYEGAISLDKIKYVVEKFVQWEVEEVSLGDTIGVATPQQVYTILQELKKDFDLAQMAMHFHDTRGMALANVLVSLEQGVATFDSSAGGLGGCPYAKGASGNLATEDLVYLLHSLGINTGVDLKKLTEASSFILGKLERSSSSKVHGAYLKSPQLFDVKFY